MFENEKIAEIKICKHCKVSFEITDKDLEFYEKVSPVFEGKKYLIPSPNFCPDCRQQRRLSFRNERNLYKRKCDFSGKDIIATCSSDKPYKIYERQIWWSDKWDAFDYGRDFDFEKSFFDQFDGLMKDVPHSSMNMANDNINCEFTNYSVSNKNVYMSFGITENEDCMYGKFTNKCKNSIDCLSTYMCNWCYEGYDSVNCYKCFYFINSTDCRNCILVENCIGCKDCIGCIGLVNKQYFYLNKYIGKENYENLLTSILPLQEKNMNLLKNGFSELKKNTALKYANIQNCENSFGDMLLNCKNCLSCFDLVNSENCKYCWYNKNSFWSMDNVFNDPSGIRYCYETCSTLGERYFFSFFILDSSDIYYSVECAGCNNLFGCVGLKNKSYCILNKQYSKEDYEKIVPKIIEKMQKTGEWGEFFPISLSLYCYNESIAQEYFPITKENGINNGYKWKDELITINVPEKAETIDGKFLNQNPQIQTQDLCKKVILCCETGRPFRILDLELEFYKNMGIGIPKKHPDQRYLERMQLKNPKKIFERKCDKCGKKLKTTYSPDRKEIIYCESCYEKEIY